MCVALLSCKEYNDKNAAKPQLLTGEAIPEWMKPKVDEIQNSDLRKFFYVVKANYLDEDVYLFSNCCPMCGTAFTVYRTDGTIIANADPALVKNSEVVWKPEDFVCTVQ